MRAMDPQDGSDRVETWDRTALLEWRVARGNMDSPLADAPTVQRHFGLDDCTVVNERPPSAPEREPSTEKFTMQPAAIQRMPTESELVAAMHRKLQMAPDPRITIAPLATFHAPPPFVTLGSAPVPMRPALSSTFTPIAHTLPPTPAQATHRKRDFATRISAAALGFALTFVTGGIIRTLQTLPAERTPAASMSTASGTSEFAENLPSSSPSTSPSALTSATSATATTPSAPSSAKATTAKPADSALARR